MIVEQGPQPCAYKNCACEVPAGQTYCGPHCANASVETESAAANCSCGHGPCHGAAETEARSNIEHV